MSTKFETRRIKGIDLLFFLAYGLFLSAGILSTSFYYKYYSGVPHKVIIVVVLALLIYKELYGNRITRKSLFTLVVGAGLFFLVNHVGSVLVAVMFLLIWSSRNIDFRQIARFSLAMSMVLFAFIICSSHLGIIKNVVITRGNRVRYYLGFRYALYGPAILYNITSLYLYIKKAKIKWLELLILFAVNYWVYVQTNSRLSFCLTVFVMFSCVMLRYFPNILKKRRILCLGMIGSFWVCALVSIGLTALYNSSIPWMNSLNSILGGRLKLGKNSILEYGIPMFGQKVSWNGWGLDVNGNVSSQSLTNYNYVDCGYLNVLQHYGILLLAICLIVLTIALVKCYQRKNYYLLILLTLVALHAMIDDLIIYLFYNTLWFVAASPIEKYVDCRRNLPCNGIANQLT